MNPHLVAVDNDNKGYKMDDLMMNPTNTYIETYTRIKTIVSKKTILVGMI